MSEQFCRVCEYTFKDGEDIVAVMLSKYRAIESDACYAIEQPTQCVEIIHKGCYDGEDRDDRPDGTMLS